MSYNHKCKKESKKTLRTSSKVLSLLLFDKFVGLRYCFGWLSWRWSCCRNENGSVSCRPTNTHTHTLDLTSITNQEQQNINRQSVQVEIP